MTTPCTKEAEIARIDQRTIDMSDKVDAIHKVVVGSNGDGLRGKTKSNSVQIKFQWAILFLVFIWLVVKPIIAASP